MLAEVREDVLKRLASVQGHLEGIRRMVERDAYCVDILKQIFAVQRALDRIEQTILDNHLKTCVVEGIRGDRAPQVLKELSEIYALANRS
ncbi:MAG: metal-sensitive transcriptional regulator [Dehalococcoidia bacterium]|nr:metal-sensitive transcriptional regulator [Dehalococcoidia bacterium]MDW8119466.1 metal-sensitive transcriptional regulator [Chloroflexota bacterium]